MADPLYCSFCGRSQHETPLMLAGPVRIAICSECIITAGDQLVEDARSRRLPSAAIAQMLPRDRAIWPEAPREICDILNRATREMTLAEQRHPQPNYTTLKVAEEAGEVIKAAVHYRENRGSWSDVEAEAVQAIAMILRLLHEGDRVNGIIPPATEVAK